MTLLLDGSLMLGGLEECFQRDNRVYTHALNCASEIQLCDRVDAVGFKCGIADDCDEADIRDILGDAVAFVADARSHGGRVFVHCLEGKSRSVCVCIAYLVCHVRYSFDDALAHVRQRRPSIDPYPRYLEQTRLWCGL
jgi:protein-tyrosine phosphatase